MDTQGRTARKHAGKGTNSPSTAAIIRFRSYQMTSVHDCQSMRSCSGILPFHTVLVTAPPRRLRTRRAFAASRPRRFPLGLAASKPPLCRGHTCPPRTEPPSGPFSSADAACSCSCRCPSSVVFADEGRLQLDRATLIASMQNLG